MSMARIIVKVPVERLHELRRHADELGTSMSARARALLLADLENAAHEKQGESAE